MTKNGEKATDVLLFRQSDPDGVVLGDIFISVETAFKQTNEGSINLDCELRILLLHGILHLVVSDYDFEREGDWLIVWFYFYLFIYFLLPIYAPDFNL